MQALFEKSHPILQYFKGNTCLIFAKRQQTLDKFFIKNITSTKRQRCMYVPSYSNKGVYFKFAIKEKKKDLEIEQLDIRSIFKLVNCISNYVLHDTAACIYSTLFFRCNNHCITKNGSTLFKRYC